MSRYVINVFSPIFRCNDVYWSVFFWVEASKSDKISKCVNDFVSVMNWSEDDYPRDALLRRFHKAREIFFRTRNNGALDDKNIINQTKIKGWIELTYRIWEKSSKFYGVQGDYLESYLDFLNIPDNQKNDFKDIVMLRI